MSEQDIKITIRCLHRIYYKGDFIRCKKDAVNFHKHLEVLFNFADIKESLVENNPGELTADEFLRKGKNYE